MVGIIVILCGIATAIGSFFLMSAVKNLAEVFKILMVLLKYQFFL